MGLADRIVKAALTGAGAAARAFNVLATDPDADFDQWLDKAAMSAKSAGKDGNHDFPYEQPEERKALHFDPFDLVAAMGYRERPSAMTIAAMDRVGKTVPVIADIIGVRTNQVQMFCNRPVDKHGTGFEVRPRDPDAKWTRKVEKRCAELEDVLLHCGLYEDEQQTVSLSEFARMFIPDSLALDQATFEVVPDRKGRPSYFSIVDATTIRLLDPAYRDRGDVYAVQVMNGSIVADFKPSELAFCIRNPRSGVKSYGYGLSEVETLVREITSFLWALQFNRNFFSNGAATRGVLNFKGTIPEKQLRAFRRQWYAMVSGVANAWRTPITNAEELQWVNMQMSNRDMEYSAFVDFLIKVCCARYAIAPEEVQFSYGNTGQTQAMGQAPLEEKIKMSKDLGLRPLVLWFFRQLNMNFLSRLDQDYEAVPVGLDDNGEEAEAQLLAQQNAVFLTIDEAREVAGKEPLGDEKFGNVINNPGWVQVYLAKQQADNAQKMQDQQMQMAQQQPQGDQGAQPPGDDGAQFGSDFDANEPEQPEPSSVDAQGPGQLGKSSDRTRRLRGRYTVKQS